MSKRKTLPQFIKESNNIHHRKYNYLIFEYININNLEYKELKLIKEDKNGLMVFDDDIVNDFNELDIEIKYKQKYPFQMINFINYKKDIVYSKN